MRQSIINKLNSNNMSKKVIEPVIIEQSDGSKIEITPYGSDFLLVIQEERPINILNDNRTTVAKAICPEYQKGIDELEFLRAEHPVNIAIRNENKNLKDQNAKLVEALEKVKDMLESPKLIDGRVLRHIVNEALQNNKKIEG